MRLFFETASQASSFLASVPLGFAAALCMDCGKRTGIGRVLLDLLWFVLCGISLLSLIFVLRDSRLRIYHALGVSGGILLYLRGIGSVKKYVHEGYRRWKMSRIRQEKPNSKAK